jgi:ribonuclease HII
MAFADRLTLLVEIAILLNVPSKILSIIVSCPGTHSLASNIENQYLSRGFCRICGVDEAGRGPLAGPVVAAAVVLPVLVDIENIRDSKRLSSAMRENLFEKILQVAQVGVGEASPAEIDAMNILKASLLAMKRAVDSLKISPDIVLVDGLYTLPTEMPSHAIVKGDARVRVISAASIIAKVTRDHIMLKYENEFPGYGFSRHKGYPTREHLQALRRLGPTPIHRKTFRGVLPLPLCE